MRVLGEDGLLLHARHVAEHAYCPRLFYLMHVEGVFLPSSDTERGSAVHRRVDEPTIRGLPMAGLEDQDENSKIDRDIQHLGNTNHVIGDQPSVDEKPGIQPDTDEVRTDDPPPTVARSLTLSSHVLGVIAVLDLVEFDGTRAVPVEYRKGRPQKPKIASRETAPSHGATEPYSPLMEPQPWPTDRIQVGIQVLLLEECGCTVPHAIVYYSAEKRRLVLPVDEALRADARRAIESARATAASPRRPPPLIASPKCPRCSLQPVCLPDEVNHERLAELTFDGRPWRRPEDLTPRRIWPPRDDGLHVVAQRDGVHVGVVGQAEGGCLRFIDADGEKIRDMPLAGIESLSVLGNVQLSTQAMHALADHQVPVAFATRTGRLVAMVDPLGPVSANVRVAQVQRLAVFNDRLALARAVVSAKIANQRTLLMRNAQPAGHPTSGGPVDSPQVAIALGELGARSTSAGLSLDLAELMGHEGQAAAVYFSHFSKMLAEPELQSQFDKNGRQRRPPPDPVNAALSLGYSVLAGECVTACRLASLEPSIGAMHIPRPGRPALALDLMEPFRPLIVDSAVITAFNRGELQSGHFQTSAQGTLLTDHGRKAFFAVYARRMDHVVTHSVFGYRLSYRRMLVLHARMIAAWLMREVPTLAFLTTR